MRYECDYREEVKRDWEQIAKELESVSDKEETPEMAALKKEHFARILEISKLKESQYQKVKNDQKLRAMKCAYRDFEEAAIMHGGKVVLDINEDRETASLSYTGKELFNSNPYKDNLGEAIRNLLVYFPDIWISADKGEFTMTISGSLYNLKRVKDLSKEIEKKTQELRQWTREKYPVS